MWNNLCLYVLPGLKKIWHTLFYDIVQSSVLYNHCVSKAYETENLIRKWEVECLTSKRNKTSLPTSAPLFYVAIKWEVSYTILWFITRQNVEASLYFNKDCPACGIVMPNCEYILLINYIHSRKRHEWSFKMKVRMRH